MLEVYRFAQTTVTLCLDCSCHLSVALAWKQFLCNTDESILSILAPFCLYFKASAAKKQLSVQCVFFHRHWCTRLAWLTVSVCLRERECRCLHSRQTALAIEAEGKVYWSCLVSLNVEVTVYPWTNTAARQCAKVKGEYVILQTAVHSTQPVSKR